MPREHGLDRRLHSLRLASYDYRTRGFYLVTACAQGRSRLLGVVEGDTVILSPKGIVVRSAILDLPRVYPDVAIDTFVVMPDHVHVLVELLRITDSARPLTGLSEVVRGLKSRSAQRIARLSGSAHRRFWQRGFHDRIVRDEAELAALRLYLRLNPRRWTERRPRHDRSP